LKAREAQIPENQKGVLRDAVQRLVDLYMALNQPAEADAWRALLPE
jgi:hypothetical protein